jgi:hypothetical protein
MLPVPSGRVATIRTSAAATRRARYRLSRLSHDDAHKTALSLAGYRWKTRADNPDLFLFIDEDDRPIGHLGVHTDGSCQLTLNVDGGIGNLWSRCRTLYPVKADAMCALEEIAYALFAAGIKL